MITPMLAKIGEPADLDRKDHIFEPKLDGTRALCYKGNKLNFVNRRGADITERYPELDIADSLACESCVLDGEIVVYDKTGNPDFNLLQQREHLTDKVTVKLRSRQLPATFVAFDILFADGKDLRSLALLKRKNILDKVVNESIYVQVMFFTDDGRQLWKIVEKRSLEGVMAKRSDSIYENKRSSAWLKIKFTNTADCVIIGFTQQRRSISSLALGLYDDDRLAYVGKVGTGFTETILSYLYLELSRIEQDTVKDIHKVDPIFVCEVKYLAVTKEKKLRAPVFLRLRDDKEPEDCRMDQVIR